MTYVDPKSEAAKDYISAELSSEVITELRQGAITETCPHSNVCSYVHSQTLNQEGHVYPQTTSGEIFLTTRDNSSSYTCPALEIHNRHFTDIGANDRCSYLSMINNILEIKRAQEIKD